MHSRRSTIFRQALQNRQTVPNHGEPARLYLLQRKSLKEPFAVINADDYYGKEAYVKVHDYLVQEHDVDEALCRSAWQVSALETP